MPGGVAHTAARGAWNTGALPRSATELKARCDPAAVTLAHKPVFSIGGCPLGRGPATEDGLHPLGQLPQLGLQVRLELEAEVPFHSTGIHRVIQSQGAS